MNSKEFAAALMANGVTIDGEPCLNPHDLVPLVEHQHVQFVAAGDEPTKLEQEYFVVRHTPSATRVGKSMVTLAPAVQGGSWASLTVFAPTDLAEAVMPKGTRLAGLSVIRALGHDGGQIPPDIASVERDGKTRAYLGQWVELVDVSEARPPAGKTKACLENLAAKMGVTPTVASTQVEMPAAA